MRGRGVGQSLAASPTMVGAVTTLIVIVAVFLAYNANSGLPFVPVYRVSVEVPNASRVVDNNEVRIGGNRVGVVESVEPVVESGSETVAQTDSPEGAGEVAPVAAKLNLKLDKTAQPLPKDSIFRVRYRSSFGLKYIEIVRGTGDAAPEGFVFDGTDDGISCDVPTDPSTFSESIPEQAKNGCFQPQTEFDAINNTFDTETRTNGRINLTGYGSAFAGRGMSLNDTIAELRPLFEDLGPVAKTLADPDTGLRRFITEIAETSRIVAPVAEEQAQLFTNMAIAFEAFSRDRLALQESISEGPATLATGIATLPRQRPFLREFAELSRRLRPGVQDLRISLPSLNSAIRVGTPVLNDTPPMNRDLRRALLELRRLVDQPTTKVSLMRLRETFRAAKPLAKWVVPSQTVCNYWNYWFTYLTEHITERDQVGYQQRIALVNPPPGPGGVSVAGTPLASPGEVQTPVNGYSGLSANGRAGLLPNPAEFGEFKPYELPILHGNPYSVTGQPDSRDGRGDCQPGQNGYVRGDLSVPGQPDSVPAVTTDDLPGNRGVTDLFLRKDGTREFRDTRVGSRQP